MPSFLHEAMLYLFRSRPRLAAELLELVTGVPPPPFATAELLDPALPDLVLASRRADAVVVLKDALETPVLGIVVEVQLAPDEDKRLTWPLYRAALAMVHRCPMTLLAVCSETAVAAWAGALAARLRAEPGIVVLGPEAVPRVRDLPETLRSAELMVLSIRAHGRESGILPEALAALTAVQELPGPEAVVYWDLLLSSLGEATRRAVEELMERGQYEYQSDFARRYFGEGREKGREEGREEGREGLRTVARRLLAEGMSVARVAALTDLGEDEVRQLAH
jgi:hypothetical protein